MIQETETAVQTSVKPKPNVFVLSMPILTALVLFSTQKACTSTLWPHLLTKKAYLMVDRGSHLEHLQVFLFGDSL